MLTFETRSANVYRNVDSGERRLFISPPAGGLWEFYVNFSHIQAFWITVPDFTDDGGGNLTPQPVLLLLDRLVSFVEITARNLVQQFFPENLNNTFRDRLAERG
jgi:hypothetical protein